MGNGLARVTVYDRQGLILAEIEPYVDSVSWRLGEIGKAEMGMAWSDPKCTEEILRLGNRVYIEFDNGLPAWGGVIDPPFNIDGRSKSVSLSVCSGEQLLDWRYTDYAVYLYDECAGFIASHLLSLENEEYPTGITVGSVFAGLDVRTEEYHHDNLLSVLQDLVRDSGQEYRVSPIISDGVLSFSLEWSRRLGQDKSDSRWLLDAANVKEARQDWQGRLASRVILVGSGPDWSEYRTQSEASDAGVRDMYGYREFSEVRQVADQLTLDVNTTTLGEEMARPKVRTTIEVVDEEPALFSEYDVGDILRAVLFTDSSEWAYDKPVRILSREWDQSGSCRLEVQEWDE